MHRRNECSVHCVYSVCFGVLTTSELTYISQSLPDSSTQMMAWLAPSEFWVCAMNYTKEKQIERESKRVRIDLLPDNNLNFHFQNLMPKTPPSPSFTWQSSQTSPSRLLPTPHLSSKIWAWSSRMLQFKSHFLELLILLPFYNHTSHQARILEHNNSSFFFFISCGQEWKISAHESKGQISLVSFQSEYDDHKSWCIQCFHLFHQ